MFYRFLPFVILSFTTLSLFSQQYSARTAHLYVKSSNNFANIEADNYQVNSTIDAASGKINLLGLLKSFEFRIGGLDQAFNSKLVQTLHHPKFKYLGKITNISSVNFDRPGRYPVNFEGTLYLWDQKRVTPGKGTIEVFDDGSIAASSDISFMIEEASMQTANRLIKNYLPPGVNVNTDRLGISRKITVQLDGKYRKRRSSSLSAN